MFPAQIKFFLFSIFSILFFSFLFVQPIFAQTTNTSSGTSKNITLPSNLDPQSPEYANKIVFNILHAFSCIATGSSDIGPCIDYTLNKDFQGKISATPILSSVNTSGGILGVTLSFLEALYDTPPLSARDYLASVGTDMGIIKPVHAQVGGTGSSVLSPIFALWQVSRNIAYLFMIFIFLVIGLMVMFRQRLNPQTVISVQMALPGLVIGLVFITLSYFLAALISDVAFIGTNLVGYYFAAAQNDPTNMAILNLSNTISDKNALSIFSPFIDMVSRNEVKDIIDFTYYSLGSDAQFYVRWFLFFLGFQMSSPLGGAIPGYGEMAKPIVGLIGGLATANDWFGLLSLFIKWILIFILIYTMIKLLYRLIITYLNIIFLTIIAPFQFLAASLPGRQGLITSWILNMLCHVLAFPAVLAVLYFAAFILGETKGVLIVATTTSLSNNPTFPLLGGLNLNLIRILLAYGALIATPAIPEVICRTIGKISQAGQVLGNEVNSNITQGQNYYNQNSNRFSSTVSTTKTGLFGESQYGLNPATGRPQIIPTRFGVWQAAQYGNPFPRGGAGGGGGGPGRGGGPGP